MLRFQNRVIRQILQSRVLCSVAITPKSETPRVSLLQKLSVAFEDISPIIDDLRSSELNNIHFDEWKNRICTLKKHHFNDKECFKMISKYPCLLKIPLEKFNESAEQWFAANLKMNDIHLILLRNPYLLEVDVMDIKKRLPKLHFLFRTPDAVTKLLFNSPNVMYDNWELVLKKIYYLIKIRGFKTGDIIDSSALSKSFNFIKFRFYLLEKCGIYKQDNTPIHKVNKYDKSKFLNPQLKSILELNLNHFTAKVAKISSEEYKVSELFFNDQEYDDINEDE